MFRGGDQHDAHELLRSLLDILGGEIEAQTLKSRRQILMKQVARWDEEDCVAWIRTMGLEHPETIEAALRRQGLTGPVIVKLLAEWSTKEGRNLRKLLDIHPRDPAAFTRAAAALWRCEVAPAVRPLLLKDSRAAEEANDDKGTTADVSVTPPPQDPAESQAPTGQASAPSPTAEPPQVAPSTEAEAVSVGGVPEFGSRAPSPPGYETQACCPSPDAAPTASGPATPPLADTPAPSEYSWGELCRALRQLDQTPVTQAFGGLLRTRILCLGCGRPSDRLELFLDMSLPLVPPLDWDHSGSKQPTTPSVASASKPQLAKRAMQTKTSRLTNQQKKKLRAQQAKVEKESTPPASSPEAPAGPAAAEDEAALDNCTGTGSEASEPRPESAVVTAAATVAEVADKPPAVSDTVEVPVSANTAGSGETVGTPADPAIDGQEQQGPSNASAETAAAAAHVAPTFAPGADARSSRQPTTECIAQATEPEEAPVPLPLPRVVERTTPAALRLRQAAERRERLRDTLAKAMAIRDQRYRSLGGSEDSSSCSLRDCLAAYAAPSLLAGSNAYACAGCTQLAGEIEKLKQEELQRKLEAGEQVTEEPHGAEAPIEGATEDAEVDAFEGCVPAAGPAEGWDEPKDPQRELVAAAPKARNPFSLAESDEDEDANENDADGEAVVQALLKATGPAPQKQNSSSEDDDDDDIDADTPEGPVPEERGAEEKDDGDHEGGIEADDAGAQVSQPPKPLVKSEAIRLSLVAVPPLALTLHIKRFAAIRRGNGKVAFVKSAKRVEFPQILDFSDFLWREKQKVKDGSAAETMEDQEDRSGVLQLDIPMVQRCRYRLWGVVEHQGSMAGGHYVAYVRKPWGGDPDRAVPSSPVFAQLWSNPRFVGAAGDKPPQELTLEDILGAGQDAGKSHKSDEARLESLRLRVESWLVHREAKRQHLLQADEGLEEDGGGDLELLTGSGDVAELDDGQRWYYFSDREVQPVDWNRVSKTQPYLLFYERLG